MLGQNRLASLVKEYLDHGRIPVKYDLEDKMACLDCAMTVPQELLPVGRLDELSATFANAFMHEALDMLPANLVSHVQQYLD